MADSKVIEQSKESLKHSRLGIISFIFSLFFLLFCVSLYVLPYLVSVDTHKPLTLFLLIIFGFASIYGAPIGSILGFVALFEKDKKKLFPILGVSVSLAQIFIIVFFTIWYILKYDLFG